MPVFYATSKDLREFTTTEKDMKKEIARFPTPNYQTHEEDLFDEFAGANQSTNSSAAGSMNTSTGDVGMFDNAATGEADLAAQQAVRGK